MARGIASGITIEIANRVVTIAMFVEVEFISGISRVWSGVGDRLLGGNTFTGLGDLIGISTIEETEDIKSSGIELSLSGVPSALLSSILGDARQGKTATVWIAFLDSSLAIIADELILFRGRTDVPTITEGGEFSIISMRVENHLIDLKRARNHRYTQEDQQVLHPTDLFFEFVPSLQNADINWGIVEPVHNFFRPDIPTDV